MRFPWQFRIKHHRKYTDYRGRKLEKPLYRLTVYDEDTGNYIDAIFEETPEKCFETFEKAKKENEWKCYKEPPFEIWYV